MLDGVFCVPLGCVHCILIRPNHCIRSVFHYLYFILIPDLLWDWVGILLMFKNVWWWWNEEILGNSMMQCRIEGWMPACGPLFSLWLHYLMWQSTLTNDTNWWHLTEDGVGEEDMESFGIPQWMVCMSNSIPTWCLVPEVNHSWITNCSVVLTIHIEMSINLHFSAYKMHYTIYQKLLLGIPRFKIFKMVTIYFSFFASLQ